MRRTTKTLLSVFMSFQRKPKANPVSSRAERQDMKRFESVTSVLRETLWPALQSAFSFHPISGLFSGACNSVRMGYLDPVKPMSKDS